MSSSTLKVLYKFLKEMRQDYKKQMCSIMQKDLRKSTVPIFYNILNHFNFKNINYSILPPFWMYKEIFIT